MNQFVKMIAAVAFTVALVSVGASTARSNDLDRVINSTISAGVAGGTASETGNWGAASTVVISRTTTTVIQSARERYDRRDYGVSVRVGDPSKGAFLSYQRPSGHGSYGHRRVYRPLQRHYHSRQTNWR
ncbi:MAG: hypothetical protein AAF636_16445 [Pseudomonadota bacterium]